MGAAVITPLRLLAVLFAGRGVMNLFKRFGSGSGLVVFGHLLPPDTPLAPVLGLVMIAYGWGLWTCARWAIPLGVACALFATANLLLFPVFTPLPARIPMWAYALYVAGGLGFAWGSVWLLWRERSAGAAAR